MLIFEVTNKPKLKTDYLRRRVPRTSLPDCTCVIVMAMGLHFLRKTELEQAILSPQNIFSRSYQINDLLTCLCNQRAKDYMEGSGQLGLSD